MNILSAIYAGQLGFLKNQEALAEKAGRINQMSWSEEAQENLGADLVGMEIDKAAIQANFKTIRVSDEIFSEFIKKFGETDK